MADAERIAEPLPEIGHVVAVRGSDTLMSVEEIDGNDIECVWMKDGIVYRNRFPREVLYNRTLAERRAIDAARRQVERRKAEPNVAPWYWPFKTA